MIIFIDICEDLLSNLGVNRQASSSKIIKGNIEPLINIFMQFMVFIADLSWSGLLL